MYTQLSSIIVVAKEHDYPAQLFYLKFIVLLVSRLEQFD